MMTRVDALPWLLATSDTAAVSSASMRYRVTLLVSSLGACSFDAAAIGDSGGSSEAATSSGPGPNDTAAASDTTSDGSSSSTGGSRSTGTSSGPASGSTTGDPPLLPCAGLAELAACYDFTSVGGGTLSDLSGNGNDAAAVGVGVVPGPFGEAATFDDDSEIAVPDSPSLDIAGPLTFEVWTLVDALPSAGRMGLLDDDGQYSLMIYANDEYRCDLAGAPVFVGPVVLGEWTHVACVFDGAAVRAYVNGTQLGMAGTNGPVSTGSGEPTSIGDSSPDFDEPLLGAIGGVRVWSRALDPAELCEAAGAACPG